MQPFFEQDKLSLYCGDLHDVLPTLPESSVDFVVTDPPYGLDFMEKDWDHDVPGPEYWRAIARVCKPGYQRMICAIEDAVREIRNRLTWLYGCLDADTQCLTHRGWVGCYDLLKSDELLQWDCETGKLSWTHPKEILIRPYSGPMVHVANRHTDQFLTPNHRVYARVRTHSRNPWPSRYSVVEARAIAERSTGWTVALPMAGVLEGRIDVAKDVAYLAGWWLTDAWIHGDGKACMFSQSKPQTLAKLRECLSPYRPSEYVRSRDKSHNDEHVFYLTGTAAERLLQRCPTRELTWEMLDWAMPARLRLLDGLLDGDGSQPDAYHSRTFWSQRAGRRSVVLALCLSVGWRAYDDPHKGCVYITPTKTETQIASIHRSPIEEYTGDVWCVRVPKGAFVVQRNGRPFITGNSGFPEATDVNGAKRT